MSRQSEKSPAWQSNQDSERADGSPAFQKGARIGRAGALAIAILFGVTALWLGLAPLNGAVVMPAQVKVENYRKTVQHLEGGIVRAILVKSGDHVKAGQALLQLEEVQADAAVEGLQDQLDAERIRGARADAERLRRPSLEFASQLRERSSRSSKLQSLLLAESELFAARRKQWLGQTALLRSQAQQVSAEMQSIQEQMVAANVNRKLLVDELVINQDLHKREFVQQTRLMGFERALADKDEKRGEYSADIARARQKLIEIELKISSLQDEYIRRASDEYSDSNRRILELQERIRPLSNALARQVVTAPTSGEVVDLRVHTVGGVIGPRDVLMEIVPEKQTLLIEGKMRPEDVADLVPGQHVDVQITAFKQRTTPLLAGRVSYVSADTIIENVNGMPMPHYVVQVSVDPDSEAAMPARLSPGMPAVVFIQTKARTAMDYLLQPLTDSMRNAFREH
ncbi:HlyD family type I secretion periplasmic adaptor subunit [Roseateles albus]|uniref:Membrane fusion protein (MFP) family protein n=1 Tax=Roseateles albus TaxID=2987525 RepID=A0ABT5KHD4_9BURK|nr:HlyD family type I secretion periplasmic adaptor subunit [Roseateles albus]MDC8772874.1 HlyD family type I secretion periplasmic adaptor subunit [Roseateles albus]